MKKGLHCLGAAAIMLFAAPPAFAQSGVSIPAQFHGRWAPSAAACRDNSPAHQVYTVDARSFNEFEMGARVVRRGQVRSGTHYFRTIVFGGANENPGTLALRRAGNRLLVTEASSGQTHHLSLVRCR